jgi:hypothetical protein
VIEAVHKVADDLEIDVTQDNLVRLDYLDLKIEKLKYELRSDKNITLSLRTFFGILSFIGVLGWLEYIKLNIYLSGILTIASGLIFAISFSDTKKQKLITDINILENQKSRLNQNTHSNNSNIYFDNLVSINLRNLEEYYDLVKNSNKKSFYAALIMCVFGVLLISSGLVASYFITEFKGISYIASASGILIEVISGLMFYLYNRTILQLKGYHDSLLDVQNILLSFKLIEDIKDETRRSEAMKQMLEYLVRKRNT